jgi:multidrug efflux pump subunit AcrA (membrane-fusion protein)
MNENRPSLARLVALGGAVVAIIGCSFWFAPGANKRFFYWPTYPDRAAVWDEALSRFDTDGSGALDPREFSRFSGDEDLILSIDLDRNQRVNALELGVYLEQVSGIAR